MSSPADLYHIDDAPGWQKASGSFVDVGPHVSVEQVRIVTPSRPQGAAWTVVHRKAAVAIAPVLEDGRFVLVQQERIPVQRVLWEFPAGQIDVPVAEVTREFADQTALAELHEEIGAELVEGGQLQPCGYFFPSQGFTQEHIYLYIARPVRISAPPKPQQGEWFGDVRAFTFEELSQMIARNEITTGLTLALFAKICALRQE